MSIILHPGINISDSIIIGTGVILYAGVIIEDSGMAVPIVPIAPSAPTLALTAGDTQVSGVITVVFDGNSPITAYQYRYKLSSASNWTTWANATNGRFTQTSLTNDSSYDFEARLVNAIGTSPAVSMSVTPSETVGFAGVPLVFNNEFLVFNNEILTFGS